MPPYCSTRHCSTRRASLLVCLGFAAGVGAVFWAVISKRSSHAPVVNPLDIEVVGSDYRLYFRYPARDGLLHTSDDRFGIRNFYVPEGASVRLSLTSTDYAYLVEVPTAQVYEIAAPSLVFVVEFAAPVPGQHALLASQMCGYDHPELLGKLVVQPAEDFQNTMTRLPSTPFTIEQQ